MVSQTNSHQISNRSPSTIARLNRRSSLITICRHCLLLLTIVHLLTWKFSTIFSCEFLFQGFFSYWRLLNNTTWPITHSFWVQLMQNSSTRSYALSQCHRLIIFLKPLVQTSFGHNNHALFIDAFILRPSQLSSSIHLLLSTAIAQYFAQFPSYCA